MRWIMEYVSQNMCDLAKMAMQNFNVVCSLIYFIYGLIRAIRPLTIITLNTICRAKTKLLKLLKWIWNIGWNYNKLSAFKAVLLLLYGLEYE